MPVLIKCMEMPEKCQFCMLSHWDRLNELTGCELVNRYVQKDDKDFWENDRPSWCPLIEVPKHGRLIDFDRVEAIMKNACDECKESSMEFDGFYADCGQCLLNGVKNALMFAPAIIPAEECE